MRKILFYGWNAGFKSISFITLLRRVTSYSLSQAKAVTDSMICGQSFMIQVRDEDFDWIVAELNDIGVKFGVQTNVPT
jgi:hypothetical protein